MVLACVSPTRKGEIRKVFLAPLLHWRFSPSEHSRSARPFFGSYLVQGGADTQKRYLLRRDASSLLSEVTDLFLLLSQTKDTRMGCSGLALVAMGGGGWGSDAVRCHV